MPQYVTAIRTAKGDKLIDFNALANRNHAAYHKQDGVDPITPEMIGAQPASSAINSDNIKNQTVKAADSAKKAEQLTTGRTILTNLASNIASSFNGTENITTGVTGTLPIENGGTGATTAADALKKLGLIVTAEELNAMKTKVDLIPPPKHGTLSTEFAPTKRDGFYATWDGAEQIVISKTEAYFGKLEATVTMGDKTQNIVFEKNFDKISVRTLVGFNTGFFISIYCSEDEVEYVSDTHMYGLIYSWESGLVHTFDGRGHTSSDSPNLKVVAIRPQGVILSGREDGDYYWCYYGTTTYHGWTQSDIPSFNCIYTPDSSVHSAPAVCDGKSITWYTYNLVPTVVDDPYALGDIVDGFVVSNDFSNVVPINVTDRTINGIPYTWINGKWVYGHHSGIPFKNGFINKNDKTNEFLTTGVQLL